MITDQTDIIPTHSALEARHDELQDYWSRRITNEHRLI